MKRKPKGRKPADILEAREPANPVATSDLVAEVVKERVDDIAAKYPASRLTLQMVEGQLTRDKANEANFWPENGDQTIFCSLDQFESFVKAGIIDENGRWLPWPSGK